MKHPHEILEFIKTHKDEIKEHFGVERIGLFGSQVRGEATEESDLDFYGVFSDKSYRNLVGLYNYLEKHFGAKVDIVTDHPSMRETFRKEILQTVRYE